MPTGRPRQRRSSPGRQGLPGLPARVTIREVGLRDGLQPEEPVGVPARVALVERLVEAGLTRVEAVAFVSPTSCRPWPAPAP